LTDGTGPIAEEDGLGLSGWSCRSSAWNEQLAAKSSSRSEIGPAARGDLLGSLGTLYDDQDREMPCTLGL
jgi:hypothetical protein